MGGAENKLGHGSKENQIRPKLVEALAEAEVHIVSVSCGDHHTAALDEDGNLYTWGWGGSFFSGAGALGLGDSSNESKPVLVESLADEGIRLQSIDSGEQHMIALDEKNQVWAWGAGEYGRLGDGGSSDMLSPQPVVYFEEQKIGVTQACAGHAFNLVLTDQGEVYCWGKNDQGQLGLGGGLAMDVYSMENFPRLIEGGLKGVRVKAVAAGNSHAGAITEDGRLFMWGMRNWLEPEEMTKKQDGSSFSSVNVVELACGNNFTACVSDDGDLYTFGNGSTCCLGDGTKKTKNNPVQVPLFQNNMRVEKVACGASHIGALVT